MARGLQAALDSIAKTSVRPAHIPTTKDIRDGAPSNSLCENFPLACLNVPGSRQKIPGSIHRELRPKALERELFDACKGSIMHPIHKIPGYFP
jgi:hypothetical protein